MKSGVAKWGSHKEVFSSGRGAKPGAIFMFSIISQIEHYIFYSADRIADPQLFNDSLISFDQKKDMVLVCKLSIA